MAFKTIRLHLARNAEFPQGSDAHGYEFVAPLKDDGTLDDAEWRTHKDRCRVRRFWAGEDDEHGHLVHTRHRTWAFHYDGEEQDIDEPIFKFDRHHLVQGEYISITEHDEVQRTFLVASVR